MIPEALAWPLAALLGLVFGSFASAASWRLPKGLSLLGRSACPHCQTPLRPGDLLPLLSWLLQRGRCRHCGQAISARYPLIEAATALLFLLSWQAGQGDWALAAVLAGLSCCGMIILAADLEERIIPDAVLLPMLALAALLHLLLDEGHWDGLMAGGLLFLLTFGLQWVWRRTRDIDGIGGGDVKFLGVAGFTFGMAGASGFLVEAGLAGILFGLIWRLAGKGRVFPFAPALVAVYLAALYWPPLTSLPLELLR